MHAPIWFEFGIHIGGLKETTNMNFGVNLMTFEGVISSFMHKAKANFCHAYRVNCFEEQSENQHVGRLNIRGVPFSG